MSTKETITELHQSQLHNYCSWEDEQETTEEELQGMSRFVITLVGGLISGLIALTLSIIF